LQLHDGQRGACFVRQRDGDRMLLTTYGRSSGSASIRSRRSRSTSSTRQRDPLVRHRGCNLACKFCQNWDISKSRDMDRLMDQATPERIAQRAAVEAMQERRVHVQRSGDLRRVAMDVADACHAQGVQTVAVTAGYIHASRGASSTRRWTPRTSTESVHR
jgi:pyruvate formate lyase activating enzyme